MIIRWNLRSLHKQLGSRSFSSKLNIAGIYPPICTPFTKNGEIAWDKLQQNITKFEQHPLRGMHSK